MNVRQLRDALASFPPDADVLIKGTCEMHVATRPDASVLIDEDGRLWDAGGKAADT